MNFSNFQQGVYNYKVKYLHPTPKRGRVDQSKKLLDGEENQREKKEETGKKKKGKRGGRGKEKRVGEKGKKKGTRKMGKQTSLKE
jgi:hypothetical protein